MRVDLGDVEGLAGEVGPRAGDGHARGEDERRAACGRVEVEQVLLEPEPGVRRWVRHGVVFSLGGRNFLIFQF